MDYKSPLITVKQVITTFKKMGAETFMLLIVVGFTFQQSIVLQKFAKQILFNETKLNSEGTKKGLINCDL